MWEILAPEHRTEEFCEIFTKQKNILATREIVLSLINSHIILFLQEVHGFINNRLTLRNSYSVIINF